MTVVRLAVLSLLAVSPALAAASGKVVAQDGRPIPGANVCVVEHGNFKDCQKTDAYGFYHISHPATMTVFIQAKGYQPATVGAVEQSASIVLSPAAILKVVVLDRATGRPVPSGKVTLNTMAGQQIASSAPFNASGLRVTTLVPGDYLVRTEADGYEPGGPEPVTLFPEKENAVVVTMKKRAAPHR